MKTLVIAGHGAGSIGAVGGGYKECDLTRELLSLVVQEGINAGMNIDAYHPSLNAFKETKNGRVPAYKNYDYVIELHFNSFKKTSANGTEILIHKNEKGDSVERNILKNLCNLGFRNRGIVRRKDLLNMNTCNKLGVSYALIETCFISNPDDMKLYHANKQKIAKAIIEGIIEGFGLTKIVSRETYQNYNVGDKVIINGSYYATGQKIPEWVKQKTYNIIQVKEDRILLGGIYSWVYKKDTSIVK